MVGKVIRDLRKKKEISLRELAQTANISKSTLSNVENGNNNPSIETLEKIAKALGVQANELLGAKDKLNIAINSVNKISDMASEALSYSDSFTNHKKNDEKLVGLNRIDRIFENDKFSRKEESEIIDFIKYLLSKRDRS